MARYRLVLRVQMDLNTHSRALAIEKVYWVLLHLPVPSRVITKHHVQFNSRIMQQGVVTAQPSFERNLPVRSGIFGFGGS
jgi:hypothetical protein